MAELSAIREESSSVSSDSPRLGEQATWEWLTRLAQEVRRLRREDATDDDWEDHHDAYWGSQQWPNRLPSFKLPIVVNELKTTILNEVSDLTDNPPQIFVHRDTTAGRGDRSHEIEQAIRAEWTRNFVDMQIVQACIYSMIYPAAFLGVFMKLLPNGQKGLDVRALHPASVYPLPGATSDDDWRGVLIEEVVDLLQLREEFPETGMRVKPEASYSMQAPDAAGSPWWRFWKKDGGGPYRGPMSSVGSAMPLDGYLKAQAAKLTLFIYDPAMTDEPEIEKHDDGSDKLDGDGNPVLRIVTKPKYPNGRQIVAANGVILYDDAYEYLGPFPIVRLVAEPTTGEFWLRESPVSGVKVLAQAANKMDSLVIENATRCNSAMYVADASTGLRPKTFVPLPGQMLLKGPGEFKVIPPTPFPDSFTRMGDAFREKMKRVLGWSMGREGRGHQGNVSAELTETEISQAMGLTRLRARLLHQTVTKVVQQIFYRMAQYYGINRWISDGMGGIVQWIPIAPEMVHDYLVHVDPSSFSLRSKTMVQRLALLLARMNKVTTEYLLKILELPDADEEAKKLQVQLALQAEAAKAQKSRKGKA